MTDWNHQIIELDIDGSPKKVMNLEGHVTYVLGIGEPITHDGRVTGYQRVLNVTMRNGDSKLRKFRFRGNSNIKAGNTISTGIIMEGEVKNEDDREVAYIAQWDYTGGHGRPYERIDYMDGYLPSEEDRMKVIY